MTPAPLATFRAQRDAQLHELRCDAAWLRLVLTPLPPRRRRRKRRRDAGQPRRITIVQRRFA